MILRKILKNSSISVISQIIIMIFQFINRKVFVIFLDIEYLGYQSVFSDIFSLLSVAEMGIGGIISFHLYREVASSNTQEIGKLMYLYKWVYRLIAGVITVLGLAASALVPYIVRDASANTRFLYTVYFLQLLDVVCGYFLSYRRVIYIVDQKEYKIIQVDILVRIVIEITNLALLAIFRDYILYLCVNISISVITNSIIYWKSNRDYPYLKEKYTVTREDIVSWNMASDVKNFMVQRVAYAFYGGIDNLVVSAGCGVRTVGMFGNYNVLQSNVLKIFFYKLLNPLQAALGNILHSNHGKREEQWNQFEMLDIFSFFFASYVSIGFLVFFQPAIQIWMGSTEYLLPDAFVIVNVLTTYFTSLWEIVYKYRSVFGDFRQDRNCIILAALTNVILSISLVGSMGVVGVQIGTLIAFLFIAYGRIRFVVKGYFQKPLRSYLLKHAGLFGIILIEISIIYEITRGMPVSVGGILLRFLIWTVFPSVVGTMAFFRDPHFKDLCGYMVEIVLIFKNKLKG